MDQRDIEDLIGADVRVECTPAGPGGREAVAEFTVYCDAEAADCMRERLSEIEPDVAFETR